LEPIASCKYKITLFLLKALVKGKVNEHTIRQASLHEHPWTNGSAFKVDERTSKRNGF